MKYFGLLTYGFGFLGCGYFIVLGILDIVAPEKTLRLLRIFLTKKQLARLANSLPSVSRTSNAIVGCAAIVLALLMLQSLIRSLIYAHSR